MPHCTAPNCKYRSFLKCENQREFEAENKTTFHLFPKNIEKRKIWIERMGLTNTDMPKYAYLCSRHFSPESFDRTSAFKVRLKDDAIPNVCIQKDAVLQDTSNVNIDKQTKKRKCSDATGTLTVDEIALPSETSEISNVTIDTKIIKLEHPETAGPPFTDLVGEPANKRLRIDSPVKDCNKKDAASQTPQPPRCVDKATWVSKSFITSSPTEERLRTIIKQQKESHQKEIKLLKQTARRADKRIASLKDVMAELRGQKDLNLQELDVLNGIGASNVDLLKRMVNKSMHATVAKQFTPELRAFALTLHYYSARAYNYVRNKFDSCLPHPKTLSKWYRSVDGEPGFNTECLNAIKERAKVVDHVLIGSLVFDEMSIRQHVEYDGQKFSGYVDMGSNITNDNGTVAKDALVFLLVCVNSSWKIPVGFFLINGISGNQKATLTNQCLTLIEECGVKVKSITFDGAPANISMTKLLGCKLDDPTALEPTFLHPVTSEKVYIIPDPCHMIKLVRNILGDQRITILNGNGDSILWSYIEKIHEIQEQEGLHLGNKLRSGHVEYHKQKMKVKFATQVLSMSLAHSIEFCRTILKLDYFQKSAATEEFLKLFNDLFDIFNAKNLAQSNFKKPIHSNNKAEVINKLDECRNYILNLKEEGTGLRIVDTQRRMGFLGFLICIESLKSIFHELCEESKLLTYIPTYKLSQDHVELFFGCIRSHGGHNNNPTVRQFKAAFKKMLIHSEMYETDSGNCVPLENIAILHITSARKPENIINSSTPTARLIGSVAISDLNRTANVFDDHSYLPDIRAISEFSDRIIVYIAGFVVKHLSKIIICETCVRALSGSASDPRSALITLKSRGALHYPSHSVTMICRAAEKVIRFALKESGGKFVRQQFSEDYLVTRILSNLTETNILFSDLNDHCHDQMALEKHSVHLTSAVARKYVKIRLFHIGKQSVNTARSDRHKLNKLTLFRGQ